LGAAREALRPLAAQVEEPRPVFPPCGHLMEPAQALEQGRGPERVLEQGVGEEPTRLPPALHSDPHKVKAWGLGR
jgi:hypothetical protein